MPAKAGGSLQSERTPDALRAQGSQVSGIQAWVALPREHEEVAPAFAHHAAGGLPSLHDEGSELRLIVGAFGGERSPVAVHSEMLYADLSLRAGGRFVVPAQWVERAAYVLQGRVEAGGPGPQFGPSQLLVFAPGREIVLRAVGGPARLMLFGGDPMDGPRFLWWNFVSSSKERIEEAKAQWAAGGFPQVPGETEFIPLPQRRPGVADYP